MPQKTVISEIPSRDKFFQLLEMNTGLIVIYLTAEWCAYCKKIKPIVDSFFATSPENVICADLDVDESFDLYAYLKTKKMVNGIPALLAWKKGNTSFIPDASVTGADPVSLDNFFKQCGALLKSV
jgi:thiol-disulfide isomerase/thioredoxin